ncbi:hypothetical protein [Microbacterium candidum]|uniref:Uncharacterized protein n=1 Tax=Microbacterium candidum TaxID=3041922 RepID=A0ABT7MU36_9MICO|nr:hypothetical protein [Microbacterium sp. ASV49]MDL9977961.1 hypothetical protein [Microbacterium sp. ASV49]
MVTDTGSRAAFVLVSAAVGAGLGALSGQILFGGTAWTLIPWALGAIAIGIFANRMGTAILASGLYGYLLVALFLLTANTSHTALLPRILFALGLAFVGPVCAIPAAVVARLITKRVRSRS